MQCLVGPRAHTAQRMSTVHRYWNEKELTMDGDLGGVRRVRARSPHARSLQMCQRVLASRSDRALCWREGRAMTDESRHGLYGGRMDTMDWKQAAMI